MAKTRYWNILKLLLKLGFTALLIWLVFQKIDFRQVKSVFLQSNPGYIIAALVSFFVSQIVSSWRLLGFLHCSGLHLPFGFNFRLYLLGMFYNVFLPGGIGGDGYKIYLLRKKFRRPAKQIFLSLLLDRISGVWAIGLLIAVLSLLLPPFQTKEWWPFAFIAGTISYFILYKQKFSLYFKNFIQVHSKALLVQLLQLLSIFFILLSQGFDGNFLPYFFCFLLSTLATVIPVSIGGLGIREYVIVHAAAFFSMDKTLAVFTTLCFYILSTLTALAGAWFVYHSKEFEPMTDEKQAKTINDDAEQAVRLNQQTR
jgi:glycosyltransferase 2 family protein